jgi:hypothetical protein
MKHRHVILLPNASEIVLCGGELQIIDCAPVPDHPAALYLIVEFFKKCDSHHIQVRRVYLW